jgi:hypothetical protein
MTGTKLTAPQTAALRYMHATNAERLADRTLRTPRSDVAARLVAAGYATCPEGRDPRQNSTLTPAGRDALGLPALVEDTAAEVTVETVAAASAYRVVEVELRRGETAYRVVDAHGGRVNTYAERDLADATAEVLNEDLGRRIAERVAEVEAIADAAEPVIVRAGEAASLAEQEAPRQDLDAPRALTDESVAPTVEALVAETLRGGYPTVSAYLTAPGREDLCARVTPWLLDRAIRAFRAELDRRARIEALRNADPDDEPEVRSGTGPERQRHAEFLAELLVDEPGPEVDDPREQPAPVVWSEMVTPSLPALDGRPRVLRYRR